MLARSSEVATAAVPCVELMVGKPRANAYCRGKRKVGLRQPQEGRGERDCLREKGGSELGERES